MQNVASSLGVGVARTVSEVPGATQRTHLAEEAQQVPRPTGELSVPGKIDEVVDKLNETARIMDVSIEFKIADDHRVIVSVIDKDTGEIIRQIPPERLIKALHSMEQTFGLLMNERV
jgi:flagellar protein FlaG